MPLEENYMTLQTSSKSSVIQQGLKYYGLLLKCVFVLRQARLIKNRKDGKVVFYSLKDEHIKRIFNQTLIHINEY